MKRLSPGIALPTVVVLAVLAGLIWWAYGEMGAVAAEPVGRQDLRALQILRQGTLKAVPAGAGIARVVTVEEGRIREHQVQFKFRGHESIAVFVAEDGSGVVPDETVLFRRNEMIRYILPGQMQPSAVSITAMEPFGSVTRGLRGWAYRDFMEIPLGAASEEELFEALLGMKQDWIDVRRTDRSTVEVTLMNSPDPRKLVASQKTVLVFDLSYGGVLMKYHLESKPAQKSQPARDERVIIDWSRDDDGHVMPVKWHMIGKLERDGETQQIERTIEFTTFIARSVDPGETVFETLKVPDGTPVVDHIRKGTWKQGDLGAGLPTEERFERGIEGGQITPLESSVALWEARIRLDRLSNEGSGGAPGAIDVEGGSFRTVAILSGAALLVLMIAYRVLRYRKSKAFLR